MDVRPWLVIAAACGTAADPPQPRPATKRAAPACTRTLSHEAISIESPLVRQIVWASDTRLVAAVEDFHRQVQTPESAGIAIYDTASTTAQTVRVPVIAFALRDDQVMLATRHGVATLDLLTGCLRESEPFELAIHDAPLVAFDTTRGRFFVVTRMGFLRIDAATLKIDVDVPFPRPYLRGFAYEPSSNRVVARDDKHLLHLYDPDRLVELGNPIRLPHDWTTDGPWPRPGHAELALGTYIDCKRRQSSVTPTPRPRKADPCLDPPGSFGARVVRIELPTGKLVDSQRFDDEEYSSMSEPAASWTPDGTALVVVDPSGGSLYAIAGAAAKRTALHLIDKAQYAWGDGESFPKPFVLDRTGRRFAAPFHDHEIRIGDVRTGKTEWSAPLP